MHFGTKGYLKSNRNHTVKQVVTIHTHTPKFRTQISIFKIIDNVKSKEKYFLVFVCVYTIHTHTHQNFNKVSLKF